MATKKTVVEMYEEIMAIDGLTEEHKAFLAKRIEITKKKNAGGGEPTPKQKEKMAKDAELRDKVVNAMSEGVGYNVGDLVKLVADPSIVSSQKMTPLLTTLVTEGRVVKATVKGRSVYSLPSAVSADEG